MNLQAAKAILASRLKQLADESDQKQQSSLRKEQLGQGQRGDKRRTIRIRDDQVTDHITQKKISAKKYLRGELDELF
jgi:protein subunit release factor A